MKNINCNHLYYHQATNGYCPEAKELAQNYNNNNLCPICNRPLYAHLEECMGRLV